MVHKIDIITEDNVKKHSQTNLKTSEYSLTSRLVTFINFIPAHKN